VNCETLSVTNSPTSQMTWFQLWTPLLAHAVPLPPPSAARVSQVTAPWK
jgi:hypothetical protein